MRGNLWLALFLLDLRRLHDTHISFCLTVLVYTGI
jgi:hypothetical protein